MWCQLIIGFERNKQAEGDAKNYSLIRLLKDRKYGKSGVVPTKYMLNTGRLLQRGEDEYDEKNPFALKDVAGDSDYSGSGSASGSEAVY